MTVYWHALTSSVHWWQEMMQCVPCSDCSGQCSDSSAKCSDCSASVAGNDVMYPVQWLQCPTAQCRDCSYYSAPLPSVVTTAPTAQVRDCSARCVSAVTTVPHCPVPWLQCPLCECTAVTVLTSWSPSVICYLCWLSSWYFSAKVRWG